MKCYICGENRTEKYYEKRTLKKLVTTMAVGLLFSTTVAYGATSYYYDFTMHQT